MKLVQIFSDGKMEDIEIKATNKTFENKLIKKAKKRGRNDFKELYTWKYDNKVILCYGWIDGEDGSINNHNLIEDGYSKFLEQNSSDIKLYGDIFICCKEGIKYRDLDILEYGEFYTNNNINEEYDTDSSDDEDEEELNEEKNVINKLKKKDIKVVESVDKLKKDNYEYR